MPQIISVNHLKILHPAHNQNQINFQLLAWQNSLCQTLLLTLNYNVIHTKYKNNCMKARRPTKREKKKKTRGIIILEK
jgi:hypothetical protein